MIWMLGYCIDKIIKICNRIRCRYIVHSFGSYGYNCHIDGPGEFTASNIYCGSNVFIGSGACFISSEAKIIIGDNVMFGPKVMIVTGSHRFDVVGKNMIDVKEKRDIDDQDVIIEDDVWIGIGVTILKGVRIGTGSVIGAGSVVTHSIEPYTIVTGTPQYKERRRFSDEEIAIHKKRINKNEV